MTGTSRVCITATAMPAKASTGTVAPLAFRTGSSVVVWDMWRGLQARSRRDACVVGACVRGRDVCRVNLVCPGNYSDASSP
ncbi:hypothetical protein TPA0906_53650 [Streptomyces olivaceus]|nr:hypothetical protein TPA0906_53650 [Streptomyces olivaceus]